MCGGRCPIVWGVEWGGKKIKKIKIHRGLRWSPIADLLYNTQQKQASITEAGMKERCDKREAQGKLNVIMLGALLVDRRLKI